MRIERFPTENGQRQVEQLIPLYEAATSLTEIRRLTRRLRREGQFADGPIDHVARARSAELRDAASPGQGGCAAERAERMLRDQNRRRGI